MRERLLLFLLLCSAISLFGQTRYVAHVVDAETKELLPFASVVRPDGKGTVSNLKGEFVIEAQPADTLLITCFGHQGLTIAASDVGPVVQLHPLTRTMRELTVMPKESLLTVISRKLTREFKKNKRKKARYFYRQREQDSISSSLFEGYIDALSCVNLRESILRTGQIAGNEDINTFNTFTQVGVMTRDSHFWKINDLITPLSSDASEKYYAKYYDITLHTLINNDAKVYLFIFKKKDENQLQPIVTGNLFIDAKTLQPLTLHGHLENSRVLTNKGLSLFVQKVKVSFHIDYQQVNGFTEVNNITAFINSGMTKHSWLTLYYLRPVDPNQINFRGYDMSKKSSISDAINEAGYDPTFWNENEVIKRTAEEEAIIEQHLSKRKQKELNKKVP